MSKGNLNKSWVGPTRPSMRDHKGRKMHLNKNGTREPAKSSKLILRQDTYVF